MRFSILSEGEGEGDLDSGRVGLACGERSRSDKEGSGSGEVLSFSERMRGKWIWDEVGIWIMEVVR